MIQDNRLGEDRNDLRQLQLKKARSSIKNTLLILAMFCPGFVLANKQITVFHSSGKINLGQFQLEVNEFPDEKILANNKESTLRICESIDNSKLIIFGRSTPSSVFKALFDNPAINKSIRELMNRDGIIFFGPTTWKIVTSLPKSLMTFYLDHNLPKMDGRTYRGLKTKDGDILYMKASPNDEYKDDLLKKPNDLARLKDSKAKLLATIYYASLPKGKFDIIYYYKDKQYPLMIVNKKTAKRGSIIFSSCYNLYKETSHPFIENLIWKAYGPRKKSSARRQRRQKINRREPQRTIGSRNVIVLKKEAAPKDPFREAETVKLHNWFKKSVPQKATKVRVSSNKETLYLSFICDEPKMESIVAKCNRKDSNLWDDDSVEVFISSLDKGGDKYQYIINSNGLYYDSKNDNRYWDGKFKLNVKRQPNSWQVDLQIAYADIGFSNIEQFRINFCRNEKQLGELTSWSKSFHFKNSQTWGYLIKNGRNLDSLLAKTKDSRVGIIIRTVQLWTRHYPDSFPKQDTSTSETGIVVARNEKESTAFQFSNTQDNNLYFRIEPEPFLAGTQIPYQEVFTLKSAVPWMAKTGEVFSEPLVKMNEGNILAVPGLESRLLWLDVKTKIAPGDYKWNFGILATNSKMPARKMSINLKVLPLTFPKQLPVQIYTFGPYRSKYKGLSLIRCWKTCADYHINWVQGTEGPTKAIKRDTAGNLVISANPSDYKNNESDIQKMGLKCVFGYGIYDAFIKHLRRLGEKRTIESPEIRQAYRQWFSEWIKHLRKNNFDFESALFPLLDEPHTSVINQLVIAGEIMHEVDSEVKITATTATWSTMDDLKKLSTVMDVWLPWEPRVTSRKDAKTELAFLRSTGKNIRPYLCSRSGNTSSYLNYFRHRGIVSYLAKCDGFSLWACNSWRSNEWLASRSNTVGSWLFHHSDQGLIPTIRAEAFREGAEDLYLLQLAEKLQVEDPSGRLKELISAVSLKRVLAKGDSATTTTWRDELIRLIATTESKRKGD